MGSRRRWAALAVAPCVAGALAAGCGGSDDDRPASSAPDGGARAGFPVQVRDANGLVTVRRAPRRVVSLSPTATETLFAVGAAGQVVAVDEQSNYPKQAPRTDISPSQPSLEAIARYRPDLVVISDTSPPDLAGGLRKLGVTVLEEPSAQDLDDAYDQIRDLGTATGHTDEASDVVKRMRTKLNELFARAPSGAGLSVYHELGPELYAASSGTFIGGIYRRLGLDNVADKAARKSGTDYPQLSSEYVVSSDPDLIVFTDCCRQSAASVRTRAGWDAIEAVSDGGVTTVDADVASRWGPRLPQFVAAVVAGLERVER
jgi:iron complex transport system substrate-binding protein